MQTRVEIAGGMATISLAGRFDFNAHRIAAPARAFESATGFGYTNRLAGA